MVQHIISKLSINKHHFLHSHKDHFLKSWQPSPINMAKVSNRTFPKLKRDTEENGVKIFLQIANGYIRETQTREYKRQMEVKLLINDDFFVVSIPCIETFFMK